MILRTALIAVGSALVAASPAAAAAEVSLELNRSGGVRLGIPTKLSGEVTEAGLPLAGRTVTLDVRRHPYEGDWRNTGLADTTAADGSYSFSRNLDRNHRLRVRLVNVPPEPDVLSPRRIAYVLPAFTFTFDQRGARVVRLRQTYTVPRDARLSAPTRFYVGPCKPGRRGVCKAKRAPFRAEAETVRVRAGRYLAKATVRIPKSYRGQFRSQSCFVYSPGSGMGDPDQRCPKRYARLR